MSENILRAGISGGFCLLAAALVFGCVHGAAHTPAAQAVSESSSEQAVGGENKDADAAVPPPSSEDSAAESGESAEGDDDNNSEEFTSAEFSGSAAARRAYLAQIVSREAIPLDEVEVIEDDLEEEEDDGELEESAEVCLQPEGEEAVVENTRPGVRYTLDITDDFLSKSWKENPELLGSLSIGLPSVGRVVNAKPFPKDDAWTVVCPERTYGTEETIAYVTAAIAEVTRQLPGGSVLRINDIGLPNGGYLRPHQSHQAGRDVDISFYYGPQGPDRGPWAVANNLDLERNWALVKAFITETDVQMILVDKSIIKRLHAYAVKKGEDKAWLDSIFNSGAKSLLRHARGHRDHFHVRLYNPRAQELGRRVLPLMPKDPRQNIRYHKVTKGDTLGKIAFSFGSTIKAIQEANRLKGTMIRLGQTLAVPMRGPCVNCPLPPEVIIPPRRLPPEPAPTLLVSAADSIGVPASGAVEYGLTSRAGDDDGFSQNISASSFGMQFDAADFLAPGTGIQTGIFL